jgi:hypothetical protein
MMDVLSEIQTQTTLRTARLNCHEHPGLQDMQVFVQDVYMGMPIGVKLGLPRSRGKTEIKVSQVHSSEENI